MAQDLARDLAQGVAEDVFGAAEDERVKVFILFIVIFQRRKPTPNTPAPPPTLALR